MLTAAEARALTAESDAAIAANVERAGKLIEAEAKVGKNVVYLDHHHQENDVFYLKSSPYHAPTLSRVQKLITDQLNKLGYSTIIVPYTYQVGGGLGSMDDEPYDETGYRIQIRW